TTLARCSAFRGAADDNTLRLRHVQSVGNLGRHLLNAEIKRAKPHASRVAYRIDDILDVVRCNREPEANRPTGGIRRYDCRVHANDLAALIEQRAAGIAVIDGGVSLNVIIK